MLPLWLVRNAFAYVIGAVLSHLYRDGTEWPIAYASCTLTSSDRECNYTQLEKDALSLVFGIKKFRSIHLPSRILVAA